MEFKKAMTIIRRMCNNGEANCDKCPLFLSHNCSVRPWADSDAVRVEGILEKWAKEHPEPVYPTWREFLTSIGVIPKVTIAATEKTQFDVSGDWAEAYALTQNRIPADIAEKLGLKPKEAKD